MQELYLILFYFSRDFNMPIYNVYSKPQNLIDAPLTATVITAPQKTELRDMKRDVLHWLKNLADSHSQILMSVNK